MNTSPSYYNVSMLILAKEYMNNSALTEHTLSPDTECVGEWAFARCKNLRSIHIPAGCAVSNRAFENCPALSEVHVYHDSPDESAAGYPHLLALALRTWDREAAVLIDNAADPGSFTDYFDSRLLRYINTPDDDGFDPFLAGGEEDYDNTTALCDHIRNVRMAKAELIYERLSITAAIAEDVKSVFVDWLISHNPEISFAVLTPPSDHNEAYRDIYFELGLNRLTDTGSLLQIAEKDTRLRAMILDHNQGSAHLIDTMTL